MFGWAHLDEPDPDLARRALSYFGVRRIIGLLGVALPFVLVLGDLVQGGELRGSLSDYYYTGMRNVFVGVLFTIGAFLLSYRYAPLDDVLGDIAWVAAMTVAVAPTRRDGGDTTWVTVTHFVAAGVLFVTFAVFCLVVFTTTAPGTAPTPAQTRRNRFYRLCGVVIVVSLLVAVASWLGVVSVPLLVTESLAVWGFGAAWIVKSVPIPDVTPPAVAGP